MSLPEDPYTMELRLCDDEGMVSHEVAPDRGTGQTYLQRINALRASTPPAGEHKPVEEPFACTGSAHLASNHIRCTSPAHLGDRVFSVDPATQQWSLIGYLIGGKVYAPQDVQPIYNGTQGPTVGLPRTSVGVHTCHADCPCQTGGTPTPDFL